MASSLLERMIVTDRVVTGDALYCQRQLCEQVVGGGGDYLLIVKSNQKRLYEDIELCFDRPVVGETYGYAETEDRHGERREYRRLWVTDTLKTYLEWPGHGQVMKVESWRSIKGKTTRQVRYAITSLGTHTPADRLLQLVRDHWRIENGLHYVRDVTMGEDASQVRTGSAPQNLPPATTGGDGSPEKRGAEYPPTERSYQHRSSHKERRLAAQRRSQIARPTTMTIIERP